MVYIAAYSHADSPCQRLENSFNLVMLILPLRLDVQVHTGSITEALEEVQEHFCRHLPYPFPMEISIPHQPGAPAEVKGDAAQAIVHRQCVFGS